jgi:hypothetical protein
MLVHACKLCLGRPICRRMKANLQKQLPLLQSDLLNIQRLSDIHVYIHHVQPHWLCTGITSPVGQVEDV